MMIRRRLALAAAAGTLAATALPRKPNAETLSPLSEGLRRVSPPQPLPDGVFVTPDGASHRLDAFKGRGMVVNMWATWCAPCKAEMPALAALQAKYAGKDLVIIPLSIDSETAKDKARAFIGQNAPLKLYRDPDYVLPPAFSPPVMGVPASFFIDRQGRVRGQVNGDADWTGAAAQGAIDQLLAE